MISTIVYGAFPEGTGFRYFLSGAGCALIIGTLVAVIFALTRLSTKTFEPAIISVMSVAWFFDMSSILRDNWIFLGGIPIFLFAGLPVFYGTVVGLQVLRGEE